MLAVCGRFASFLFATFSRTQTTTCLQSWLHFRTPGRAPKKGPCPSFQDSVPIGEEFRAQIWGPDLGPNCGAQIWAHLAMLFWLLVCARRACNSPNSYALPRGSRAGCGRDICLMDQSNRSNIFSTVFRDVNLAAATRLLHSVVNNSCGFNPQWKVVALIFSAARLPRLLKEICWQFAAGLPAFSLLPFFRTQTTTCLQSWLHFRTPGRAPKKGPCPSFQDSVPIGPKFGVQIWDPNSGAQIWAHLAMLFWLLVCARRACNSPNSYALPRGGRAGCGRDICLMDQSNRSNIFSTVFRDVNLAGCNRRGAYVPKPEMPGFSDPEKGGPQFQLRLPREADSPSAPVLCSQTTSGGAPLVVNILSCREHDYPYPLPDSLTHTLLPF